MRDSPVSRYLNFDFSWFFPYLYTINHLPRVVDLLKKKREIRLYELLATYLQMAKVLIPDPGNGRR